MAQHNQQYASAIMKDICLGPRQFTGTQALHEHMKGYAPPSAKGCWYSRSMTKTKHGKYYMSIHSHYHSNLVAAVMSWSEPTA